MPPSSSLSELRLRNRAGCPGVLEVWQRFTGFWATSIDVSGSKSQLGSRRKVPGQRSASTYAGEVVGWMAFHGLILHKMQRAKPLIYGRCTLWQVAV